MTLKPWRGHRPLLIPDQHESGNQRGFKAGKQKKHEGSEHHSRASGGVNFYPVGRWAGGEVK
jgi:hypothetical protein